MGRAVIVGGGTDGRYTIEIDLGSGPRDERVAQLTSHIAKLTARISTLTLEVAAAQTTADTARADLDALASSPGITIPGSPAGKQFEQQFRLVRITNAQLGAKRSALNAFKLQREKQQRTLTALQNLDLVQQRQAWCADFTENGSGAVGTAEIPGESNLILIKPGAPDWNVSDGVLAAREVMDPNQAYFNAAILPGWQKYKPTFRRGTITDINYDTNRANVSLALHVSSAQRLNVDQQSTLANIPVTYMTCNANAFEVGDQVVVMFDDQNQSQPRVIGFVTNPKPCELFTITYIFSLSRPPETQNIYRGRDGDPVAATTPFSFHAWMGWSDGNTSLTRQETDVTASAVYTAQYTSFPNRRARIDFWEFYTISSVFDGSNFITTAGIRGRYRFFDETGFAIDTTTAIPDLPFDVVAYTGYPLPFAPVVQADYVSGPYSFSFPTINSLATSVVGTKVILGTECSVTYNLSSTSGTANTENHMGYFSPASIIPLYLV